MSPETINILEYTGLVVGILAATVILAALVNRFFKRAIRQSTDILNNDPTNYQFLSHSARAIIYMVGLGAAIYVVPNLRTLANSLLAGAGILAVAIGFASQQALSNIISGVFIIIFKPYRINARLRIRTFTGIVEDITLRHTVIRDFENNRILIPNAIISDEIIINSNFTDDKICKWIDIGISFDSDIDLAKMIMAEEILQHPLHVDTRTEEQLQNGVPEVLVRVTSLGEYSVNLRAWAWANNPADGFTMSCDLYESIKKRFDREGIEIPFPYRVLVHKEG